MLIAAAIVGLLCAYHFGLRIGMIAAGVTAVLMVAAIIMPGYALKIYGVVAAGVIGICFVGPKVSRDEARPVKRGLKTALKLARKLIKRISK